MTQIGHRAQRGTQQQNRQHRPHRDRDRQETNDDKGALLKLFVSHVEGSDRPGPRLRTEQRNAERQSQTQTLLAGGAMHSGQHLLTDQIRGVRRDHRGDPADIMQNLG